MYIFYPHSTKTFTKTHSEIPVHSKIKLELRTVGFLGEGITGVPGEKPLGAVVQCSTN